MEKVYKGEKQDIAVRVSWRPGRGSGPITLTSPGRRILDKTRAVVTNFDWAAASWDATKQELFASFDSTAVGLTTVGIYWMQLRGTIGAELYETEVKVELVTF